MEQNEPGKRQGTAKEFQETLEHLQDLLEEDQTAEQIAPELAVDPILEEQTVEDSAIFDLADWEDAIADIEQYFQNKEKDKDK
ncbi:MAG: hypothetical protein HC874_07835 [Richelia sp. SL_2_1]|nr:hypothetical protein [Richelia sp. SM2_1_7]NJO27459.1 hypothetical protein [Richelia sp. SL_2_1]